MSESENADIIKKVVFFFTGAILAFLSFFLYLYPDEVNWPVIITLCVLDFCFTAANALVLTADEDSRVAKTVVVLLIYYALFNAVPVLWFVFNGGIGGYLDVWQSIVLFSIFCGPMLIVVILLVSIVLIIIGIANGSHI